jgi:hypothetical protein
MADRIVRLTPVDDEIESPTPEALIEAAATVVDALAERAHELLG